METTRKHPRTIGEAFKDANYAGSVEYHPSPGYGLGFMAALYIVSAIGVAVIWWTR